MEFIFYGRYIYTDGDPKQVEYICMMLSRIFRVLMTDMIIKIGKTVLKISIIFFLCLRRNVFMFNLSWLEKFLFFFLVKAFIEYVDIDGCCKLFVLDIIDTFHIIYKISFVSIIWAQGYTRTGAWVEVEEDT